MRTVCWGGLERHGRKTILLGEIISPYGVLCYCEEWIRILEIR